MNVLVACECSGRVKTAFRNKGHNAWSCDLKPSEIPDDKFHYQCDVREVLNNGWDLMIAHPDCTYLSIMGGVWMNIQPERINKTIAAAEFFNFLLNQNIPKIAIENPIPNKWARKYIRHYDQLIQPSYFGDVYKKGTCLWLKNLPHFNDDPCPILHDNSELFLGGLAREWGTSTFINPPYSKPGPFCEKAYRESLNGKTVVGLLRGDTSTKWFHQWVLNKAKEIRFVEGRVCFNGKPAPFASIIVIWRTDCVTKK